LKSRKLRKAMRSQ